MKNWLKRVAPRWVVRKRIPNNIRSSLTLILDYLCEEERNYNNTPRAECFSYICHHVRVLKDWVSNGQKERNGWEK